MDDPVIITIDGLMKSGSSMPGGAHAHTAMTMTGVRYGPGVIAFLTRTHEDAEAKEVAEGLQDFVQGPEEDWYAVLDASVAIPWLPVVYAARVDMAIIDLNKRLSKVPEQKVTEWLEGVDRVYSFILRRGSPADYRHLAGLVDLR